jgi:hypothetical protein
MSTAYVMDSVQKPFLKRRGVVRFKGPNNTMFKYAGSRTLSRSIDDSVYSNDGVGREYVSRIAEEGTRRNGNLIFNRQLSRETGMDAVIAHAYAMPGSSAEKVARELSGLGMNVSASSVRRVARDVLGIVTYKSIADSRNIAMAQRGSKSGYAKFRIMDDVVGRGKLHKTGSILPYLDDALAA